MSNLEKTLLAIIGFLLVTLMASSAITAVYMSTQQTCVEKGK